MECVGSETDNLKTEINCCIILLNVSHKTNIVICINITDLKKIHGKTLLLQLKCIIYFLTYIHILSLYLKLLSNLAPCN